MVLLSLTLGGVSAGMTLAADPPPQAAEQKAAEAPADQPKEKKSFWERLRRGGAKTEAAPAPASSTAAAPTPAAETKAVVEKKPAPKSPMPASLVKTHARLQKSPLGAEPAAKALLDAVQSPSVTGDQVNQLAVTLGRRGAYRDAIAYQEWTVRLSPDNPTFWVNLGTMHRALDEQSAAGSAYKRALGIDPNNAPAHYNLGAVYERQGDYDNAVDQYRIALILDPQLADPKINPQIVNNDRLMVVQLLNYSRQSGSASLPLTAAPPAAPPAPAKAPTAAPAAPPKTPVPAAGSSPAAPPKTPVPVPAQPPPAGQRPPAANTTPENKK
jgi:tetratricopeptide (TPR) repeat protein